jgi:hypothetical protein
MGEIKNVYKISYRKYERKKSLGGQDEAEQ